MKVVNNCPERFTVASDFFFHQSNSVLVFCIFYCKLNKAHIIQIMRPHALRQENQIQTCQLLCCCCSLYMMTSSNGNIFRVTGPLCGEFTGPGEFPTQRPVTRSFDVLFDLRLNKRLSKQPWGWWFETPARSLWRQRNEVLHPFWWILEYFGAISQYYDGRNHGSLHHHSTRNHVI